MHHEVGRSHCTPLPLGTQSGRALGQERRWNVLKCREACFRVKQDRCGGAAEVEGREGHGAAQAAPCPRGHSCFLRQDGSGATSSLAITPH